MKTINTIALTTAKNMKKKKNSVNLEERILPTAVGFQAMTVTETKSWESNRIWMRPKQTPKALLTGLCMGVLVNGHLPWVFLALKNICLLRWSVPQPSYLARISLELHLVAAWPYKPYRTGWLAVPRSKHVCSKCIRRILGQVLWIADRLSVRHEL